MQAQAEARGDMQALIERIPSLLRWVFFVPASLAAGFLAVGLINLLPTRDAGAAGGPIAYAAAFLSGLAYVWAALHITHLVAPSHKRIVIAVLGFFIFGDLSLVHLILPSILNLQAGVPEAADDSFRLIFSILGANDYSGLPGGGFVKIGGVVAGLYLIWRKYGRKKSGDVTS